MKFRCKQSGNIIEVISQHDIESMKQETHYEVVEEEAPKKEKAKKEEK